MPSPRSSAPGPVPSEENPAWYDYALPPERIAQRPAQRREQARLLVVDARGRLEHRVFADLPEALAPGDLVVRNTTRVIPARLRGRRGGGGRTELLLVRPVGDREWECLARPASHLKTARKVCFGDGELTATILDKLGAGRVRVRFDWPDEEPFDALLDRLGETPLPPYIDRRTGGPTAEDRERYQTVYARESGAVAAPTAGLHFTEHVFGALRDHGVEIADLVLHVGPGTFRPVKTARLSDHCMDPESYRIPPGTAEAIARARDQGRRVVAVGTTTTRAIEAAADAHGRVRAGPGATDLFIRPPYRFRVIDGLLTNFHLPRSTLLMLVCAFAGRDRVLAAYREAVAQGYRFYSYGDAMLLWRAHGPA